MKLIMNRIRMFFRKLFGLDRWSTFGEMYDNLKYLSKKELIKRIMKLSSLLNGVPEIIDQEYYKQLRATGKKPLLKALLILQVAYTKKIEGRLYNA